MISVIKNALMKRIREEESSSVPAWWDREALDGTVPKEAREALVAFFKERNLVVTSRSGTGCDCDKFEPTEAPGYKGKLVTVCANCCKRCPRCHERSADLGYRQGSYDETCYGCAIGDHEEAASAKESDSDSESQ